VAESAKDQGVFQGEVLTKLDSLHDTQEEIKKSIAGITTRCMERTTTIAQARSRSIVSLWIIGAIVIPLMIGIGGLLGYHLIECAAGASQTSLHAEK